MLLKALRVGKIQLFTRGLSPVDLKDIFVEPVSSLEEAVSQAVAAHGDTEIAVVPEGPYVIPLYKPTGA
jgi:hypothetical protein